MKRRKTVKVGIIVALLLVIVGYATVSTTLKFTGTAPIKGNADEFNKNLRFVDTNDPEKKPTIEASVTTLTEEEKGVVNVLNSGKTLSFSTPILNIVDETATVSYYVENRGQYDAILQNITCTKTSTNPDLVDYIELEVSDNYNELELPSGTATEPTQTEEAATITVKLSKTYASTEQAEVTINCTLNARAKDETAS